MSRRYVVYAVIEADSEDEPDTRLRLADYVDLDDAMATDVDLPADADGMVIVEETNEWWAGDDGWLDHDELQKVAS